MEGEIQKLKSDEKRNNRINMLHQRALKGKYTWSGQFHYDAMVNDAMSMGISEPTARSYADAIVIRLKKGKHMK